MLESLLEFNVQLSLKIDIFLGGGGIPQKILCLHCLSGTKLKTRRLEVMGSCTIEHRQMINIKSSSVCALYVCVLPRMFALPRMCAALMVHQKKNEAKGTTW